MAATASQSPPQAAATLPARINNIQVSYVTNVLGRFATEISRCQSANVESVLAADKDRFLSYLTALDNINTYASPVPWLDLPAVNGIITYAVEPLDSFPSLQNEEVEFLLRLFIVMHASLVLGESSNMGSGITIADKGRFTANVAAARTFIASYMAASTPLDMPASDIDVNAAPAKMQPVA